MKQSLNRQMHCLLALLLLVVIQRSGYSQQAKNNDTSHDFILGAYYFDGWNEGSHHITSDLKEYYKMREPVWGWVTSTSDIVDSQIKAAADAGIKFFAFDWYFRNGTDDYPLNHALNLYLLSPDKNRLKFCLMVANHDPFVIGPDNWDAASKIWIKLFKSSGYLTVNKRPLIIFFSPSSLIEHFGSAAKVKEAFASLRDEARKEGLGGVSIAACVYNNVKDVGDADACGFDVMTGYNYHGYGLQKGREVTPIDSMQVADRRVWDGIRDRSSKPYIPVATLNWDPRPWRPDTAFVPHFSGYSMQSVYRSVMALRKWTSKNARHTPKEKIALMYAWNENGEGGWLTPSHMLKDSLLLGIKHALGKESK